MQLVLQGRQTRDRILASGRLDQRALPKQRSSDLALALSKVYEPTGILTPSVHFANYESAFELAKSEIAAAALAWANETLPAQACVLGKIMARLKAPRVAESIAAAARRISTATEGFVPDRQELAKAVSEIAPLRPREFDESRYMREFVHAEARLARKRVAVEVAKEKNELVTLLFAHPKGVEILRAYAESEEDGTDAAVPLLDEARNAMPEFLQKLNADPAHIWLYPILVERGVQRLGLDDPTHFAGFGTFAVAIGEVLSVDKPEIVATGIALAVMYIGLLVTGPAAVVVAVADLAVSGTTAGFVYLRERERDLAAASSVFMAPEERIAEGAGYAETALAAAGAVLSAVSFLIAATAMRRLLQQKPKQLSEILDKELKGSGTSLGGAEEAARRAAASPRETAAPIAGNRGLFDRRLENAASGQRATLGREVGSRAGPSQPTRPTMVEPPSPPRPMPDPDATARGLPERGLEERGAGARTVGGPLTPERLADEERIVAYMRERGAKPEEIDLFRERWRRERTAPAPPAQRSALGEEFVKDEEIANAFREDPTALPSEPIEPPPFTEAQLGLGSPQKKGMALLLGKRFNDDRIKAIGEIWKRVDARLTANRLSSKVGRPAYESTKRPFFKAITKPGRMDPVVNPVTGSLFNTEARKLVTDAGLIWDKPGNAPYLPLPGGGKIILTIDHIEQVQSAPGKATLYSNLQFTFWRENTVVLKRLVELKGFATEEVVPLSEVLKRLPE